MKSNKKLFAVITGGTKGMGRAMVEKFSEMGYAVATCSRNENDLKELTEAILKTNPLAEIITQKVDLSKKEAVLAFGEFIKNKKGTPDLLINNAGIFTPGKISEEIDGSFEYQWAVNMASGYYLTRCFLPGMMEIKKGYIINMCSTASITPYINGGSYCISKYAQYGFTKVLREELKSTGIKVTAIMPGATLTDSWSGTDLPSSRFLNPKDIAEIVYQFSLLPANSVPEEFLIRPLEGDIS